MVKNINNDISFFESNVDSDSNYQDALTKLNELRKKEKERFDKLKELSKETNVYRVMDLDMYISELNIKDIDNSINSLKEFVNKDIYEFESEFVLYLDLMEEEEFISMAKYFPQGIYESARYYVDEQDELDHILKHYKATVGDIRALRDRVDHKYSEGDYLYFLVVEALATILLKEYQHSKCWQTTLGASHQYAIDLFEKAEQGLNPAINGWEKGEYATYSDMSSFYGCDLSNTIEVPASMHDVFAYLNEVIEKEEYEETKTEIEMELDSKKLASSFFEKTKRTIYRNIFVPSFTPDMEMFEGVMGRWKYYKDLDLSKESLMFIQKLEQLKPSMTDYKLYHNNLLSYGGTLKHLILSLVSYEIWSDEEAIRRLIKQDYLYRFSKPPYSFPIPEDALIIETDLLNTKRVMRVKFNITGVCDGKKEKRNIINKVYKFPEIDNIPEIQRILMDINNTIKEYLVGMEKKGKKKAIEGLYPRKNHATHGIKLDKYFNKVGLERATYLAELQSIYAIKRSVRYSNRPVVSTSFGVDSVLVMYLVRKVIPRIDYAFNNTGVNYGEIAEVRKELSELWGIKKDIHMLHAESSYWEITDKYGWNFGRKSSKKTNGKGLKNRVSERCCATLKHIPMMKGIQKFNWDMIFTGIRADESLSRSQSGKRDGISYTSKSWGTFRVNPILFWTDDMVWHVTKRENIPYCKIYDMVLYEKDEYGNDTDKIIYKPRVGCWSCCLTAKYGYFRWLKEFKPKQFRFLMKDKKLGELLFRLHFGYEVGYTEKGGLKVLDRINKLSKAKNQGQLSLFDDDTFTDTLSNTKDIVVTDDDIDNFDMDIVFNWVQTRPCKVDDVLKKIS